MRSIQIVFLDNVLEMSALTLPFLLHSRILAAGLHAASSKEATVQSDFWLLMQMEAV